MRTNRQTGAPQISQYTPESKIRRPGLLFRKMFRDLAASRELAWRLFIRDVSAQYRQTLLGYLWAVFPPLVTLSVFLLLHASALIQVSDLGIPYPVYVLIGTVFWQVFVDSMNAPLKMALENREILIRVNLTKESLILAGIGRVCFSLAVKAVLLTVFLVVYGIPVRWTVVFLPIALVSFILLGTVLGVLLLPLGLLYKDVQSALLIVTSGLVFVTPVAYPSAGVGLLGQIMKANPLTPLLQGTRDLFFLGLQKSFVHILLSISISAFLLLLGWVIYRLALPIIIERIGA